MEAAVVSCNSRYIEKRHLPAYFLAALSSDPKEIADEPSNSLHLESKISEIEKEYISRALKETSQNKSKAMKMLGISRSAFYDKIKKYNIPTTA
jgi:DNA-binding NtrC family response regulator